jgi:hypothetical protein
MGQMAKKHWAKPLPSITHGKEFWSKTVPAKFLPVSFHGQWAKIFRHVSNVDTRQRKAYVCFQFANGAPSLSCV